MTIIQAIILGIFQGLTEFLPISSSAHLVLVPHLLGWQLYSGFVFPFDVLVQLGTLVAVVVFYREDLAEIVRAMLKGIREKKPFDETPSRVGWLVILATIPAILAGVLLKDRVEAVFSSPTATSLFLLCTAALLVMGEFLGKKTRALEEIRWQDALWIGVFQVISLFPGVSRSGSTISGGLTRDLDRKTSGQFAFLMAVPVMLVAGLLGILDLLAMPDPGAYIPVTLIGFITAGVVGFFAIRWLIGYISSHSLLPFAGYCLILGVGNLLLTGFSPLPEQAPAVAEAESPPVPSDAELLRVSIEPDLEWLLPVMNACQSDAEDLQMLIQQKSVEGEIPAHDEIVILYGEISGFSGSVYQIGEESLRIVVPPASGLTRLPSDLVWDIFSGRIKTWQAVHVSCESCFSSTPPSGDIAVFIYPAGFRMSDLSRALFPAGFTFSSASFIAPGAKAVREAVSRDPAAIGILPASWVDASVAALSIENGAFGTAQIPILAYASRTMDADLESWLICVQKGIE